MQRHHYRLGGKSLRALNMLIKLEAADNRLDLADFKEEMQEKYFPGQDFSKMAEEDAESLVSQFSEALKRAYQEVLGFNAPAVEVRKYGAYHCAFNIFPEIAVNPPTSKGAFGFAQLFNDLGITKKRPDVTPEKRTAFYLSHDDYTGNHFVPPDAVKMTDEEVIAWRTREDEFQYLETYAEGTEMPADFDPAKHKFSDWTETTYALSATHAFLIGGDKLQELKAWDEMQDAWMKNRTLYELLQELLGDYRLALHMKTVSTDAGRFIQLEVGQRQVDTIRAKAGHIFDIEVTDSLPFDGCHIRLTPRLDTQYGKAWDALLTLTPSYPEKPDFFGFGHRSHDEQVLIHDGARLEFPYLRIENYEEGAVKLLALRFPPYISEIDAPEDCTAISLDEYASLGGDMKNPPSHVFRIGSASYDALAVHDAARVDYQQKSKTLEDALTSLLKTAAPEWNIDTYERVISWEDYNKHFLHMFMPETLAEKAKEALEKSFRIVGNYGGYKYNEDRNEVTLAFRDDTPEGRAMIALDSQIPAEPLLPDAIWNNFGFNTCKGYDLLNFESLKTVDQKIVALHMPPWVKKVEAPAGCTPLTTEESCCLIAEDKCGSGYVPALRPERLAHLPNIQTSDKQHAANLKASKDKSALPLHEKSSSSFFVIPKSRLKR